MTKKLPSIHRQPNSAGSASGLLGIVSFIFGAILGSGATAIPMALVIGISNLLACISYFKLLKTE